MEILSFTQNDMDMEPNPMTDPEENGFPIDEENGNNTDETGEQPPEENSENVPPPNLEKEQPVSDFPITNEGPGGTGTSVITVFPKPIIPCYLCENNQNGLVRFLNAAAGYNPFLIYIAIS